MGGKTSTSRLFYPPVKLKKNINTMDAVVMVTIPQPLSGDCRGGKRNASPVNP